MSRPRTFSWVVVVVLCAAGVAWAAPAAEAAVAAKASVTPHVQYLSDTTGTVFTFTVKNTSTASETLGSVQVSRPGIQWTVVACPAAPAGWSTVLSSSGCTFNSASGTSDNIAPGASATFKAKATTAPGSADVTGLSWAVRVNQADTFATSNSVAAAPAKAGALGTTIYTWRVLTAVVTSSPPAIGSACPAANKSAYAVSGKNIAICGKNRANVALMPQSANSALGGTFLASAGALLSGTLPALSGSSVVIGNYSSAIVTASVGTGKTVVTRVGSAGTQTSPLVTLAGYSVSVPSGLVSWWKAEGNANDSADGNNGSLVNGATTAAGRVGQAFTFDQSATTEYVNVPDSPNLNFGSTAPMSVTAWIYVTSTTSAQHILGKRLACGDPINYQALLFSNSSGGFSFAFGGEPGNSAQGGDIQTNTWTFVVGTFDGATFTAYVNGTAVDAQPGSLGSTTTDPFAIGDSNSACAGFGGLMDDVQVYSRALTAAEVQSLF